MVRNRLADVDDPLLNPRGAKPTIHCQFLAKRFGAPLCHSGRDHQVGRTTLSGSSTPADELGQRCASPGETIRQTFTPLSLHVGRQIRDEWMGPLLGCHTGQPA